MPARTRVIPHRVPTSSWFSADQMHCLGADKHRPSLFMVKVLNSVVTAVAFPPSRPSSSALAEKPLLREAGLASILVLYPREGSSTKMLVLALTLYPPVGQCPWGGPAASYSGPALRLQVALPQNHRGFPGSVSEGSGHRRAPVRAPGDAGVCAVGLRPARGPLLQGLAVREAAGLSSPSYSSEPLQMGCKHQCFQRPLRFQMGGKSVASDFKLFPEPQTPTNLRKS